VILVDANIIIYAHFPNFVQHARARKWFNEQLNGATAVALPWATLLAFLRVTTNPRAFPNAVPIALAWRQVRDWLACDNVWIPEPTEHHGDVLGELLTSSGANGNLVPDAHLAALAIEHGLTLYSADTDFARFRKLRWVNPLAP
jgi:uncharacterized protein